MKKLLFILAAFPAIAFGQSAQFNLSQLSHNLATGGKVQLGVSVTGNLPVTNLNGGTAASVTTFWRGDGTWAEPSLASVTGILPVANGGNGTATPALTAGTNITLSGSWPNYTISSTGGPPGGTSGAIQYNNAGAFGGLSLAAGDLLVGTASAPTALAPGANGTVLAIVSGSPAWASGILSANGSPALYDTAVFGSTSGVTGIAPGTAGQALVSAGASAYPSYSSALSDVTSIHGSTIPATAGTLAGSTGTFTLDDCLEVGSTSPVEIKDTGAACGSGGSSAFNAITSGTNTTAAMTVGSGASITYTGTGSVNASEVAGVIKAVNTASAGNTLTPNCDYAMVKVTASTYQIAAPTNGGLTQTSGGSLGAATYYVRSTWVTASGETTGASETSLAVSASNVLNVAAPGSPPADATGWNVYVSTATGTETKQNSSPIGTATAWVEPTSGLISGTAIPTSNTSGQFTLNAPGTCTPTDGQQLEIKVISPSGGIVTYSWNAAYVASGQLALPLTSYAAGKEDYFIAQYDADKSAWAYLSMNQGF